MPIGKVLTGTTVPIKIWANELEPSAEKQLLETASLPFVFKHVAVMPDVHWGMGSTVGSVVATKDAICPACVGVDLGCFVGETLIPLLNGTQKTLKELSLAGEVFYVYSINKDNLIVPGKAIALKTRQNAELLQVEISGGQIIKCTPDHKFLMRDGTYRRADQLEFNDSLMPLYRTYETRDGYERVKNPGGKVRHTHKLVAEYFSKTLPKNKVVHHIDHNHFNNDPTNLTYMTVAAHSKLHRVKDKAKAFKSKDFQKNRLQKLEIYGFYSDYGKKVKDSIRNLKNGEKNNPEAFIKNYASAGKRGAKTLSRINASPRACDFCGEILKNLAAHRWHVQKVHNNHKVIRVQKIKESSEVYCLKVQKYENFALSSGVFVHNCGMMAVKTTLDAKAVQDKIQEIRKSIERSIPLGFERHKRGASDYAQTLPLWGKYIDLLNKSGVTTKYLSERGTMEDAMRQLGTLGGGNHFIEICLDTENAVWVMLHSGSRGIGNKIANIHINHAKDLMKKWFITTPNPELAYLVRGSKEFEDYLQDIEWAQEFASENRRTMMTLVLKDLSFALSDGSPLERTLEVNCHHNYVSLENHYGENVLITRKGAVRAREGDMGIIPGSMGAKSFIVRGLGNPESFHSCSHGAGRKMSRAKARATFTTEDLISQTVGVECRKDGGVLDEIPGAYKNIDEVMANQSDLIEIVAELKQILCIKG